MPIYFALTSIGIWKQTKPIDLRPNILRSERKHFGTIMNFVFFGTEKEKRKLFIL